MGEIEPHQPGRRLDRHFRWRGTEVSRVEAIADAVFGLVLAMLLLQERPPDSFGAMFDAIKALIPFAVTFGVIAMIWFEHYLFFRRYDLHDGPTIALTFVLLFLVVGFAYPLKLVFTSLTISYLGPIGELTNAHMSRGVDSSGPVFLVYSTAFCAVYGTLALLYRMALRRRGELGLDARELFLTRSAIAALLLQMLVGALSVMFALLGLLQGNEGFVEQTQIAGWVYFLIGPLMTVHGNWQRRRMRALGAE